MPLTAGQVADWEVLAGLKPDPTAGDQLPEYQEPFAGFENMPETMGMRPAEFASTMKIISMLRKQQQESYAAAIRYQGQTEYQKMIDSGMDPEQAMRKAGPKMFYEHPAGLTASLSHMDRPKQLPTAPIQTFQLPGGGTVDAWIDKNGGLHPIHEPTQPRAALGRTVAAKDPSSTAEWKMLNRDIQKRESELAGLKAKIEKGADEQGVGPIGLTRQAIQVQREIDALKAKQEAFTAAYRQTGVPPPVTPTAPPEGQQAGGLNIVPAVTEPGSPAQGNMPPRPLPPPEAVPPPGGMPVPPPDETATQPTAEPAKATEEMVPMRSKDGKEGVLPASLVPAALLKGWSRISGPAAPSEDLTADETGEEPPPDDADDSDTAD